VHGENSALIALETANKMLQIFKQNAPSELAIRIGLHSCDQIVGGVAGKNRVRF
jgi:hypothetical protein